MQLLPAQAASFNCGKSKTTVEKLICSNGTVSKLDQKMQSVYQNAYKDTADPVGLKLDQQQWLKLRDTCKDATCLVGVYRTRLDKLKALMTEPKPCFRLLERKWPEVKSGHYPVCVDFLKSLNSFCDEMSATKWKKSETGFKIMSPFKATPRVSCDWKVNPAVNTLKKPRWEALDPKAHLKVIQNLYQHYYRDPEEKWQPIPPDRLQRINDGQTRLWHTRIDLDRDGQQEHVVRFDDLPCEHGEGSDFFGLPSQIAVVDDNASKIDARYDYLNHGFDIVVHDDKSYVITSLAGVQVKFESGRVGFRNSLELQEPFSVPETGGKGMASVCVFDYIK